MKLIKSVLTTALLIGLAAGALAVRAADKHDHKAHGKVKPYPLKTCVVSNEKLGDHGKPYVFTHAGQEIQLCCKDCRGDFDKDPGKYLKKIAAAPKANQQK